MRSLIGAGVVIALAIATGCTYVTQGDLERKRACIDVDGDGAPQGAETCEEELSESGLDTLEIDCDEGSADRAPHLPEIAYDGIDNDCDGQDLLDVDGDGKPGISKEDYDELGLLAWPDGVPDEFDCNDDDETVFPGSPFEAPYDGIDSDCMADEDYDVDGDGYVPSLNPNTVSTDFPFGEPHNPAYNGVLPSGDCDDNNADSNPGVVAIDIPYDGVDLNCDCENDFDSDGDGFLSDLDAAGLDNMPKYDVFLARYDCNLSATPDWGDCDDNAALVFPGASDIWYDGIDSNCLGDDDFDQDADGWPLGVGQDCVDTDDTIFPTALELIGDDIDHDCDSRNDVSSFAYAEAEWTSPRSPRVGWTGSHYVLAVGAEQWVDTSTGTPQIANWPGLLFRFPPEATNATEIEDRLTWNGVGGQDDPLGPVIDMATDPLEGRVYLAVSMRRTVTSGDNTYLALRGFTWTGSVYMALSPVLQSVASSDLANDVDVQISDTGSVFAGSCGDPHLQYIHAAWSLNQFSRQSVGASPLAGGSHCSLDLDGNDDAAALLQVQGSVTPDPKPYLLRDGVGALFVDQDPTDAIAGPYEDMVFGVINRDADLLSVYDTASGDTTVEGSTFLETVFQNTVVYDISAAMAPTGQLYVLAVTEDRGTDGLNDLVLRYGAPGSTMTEVEIPVETGCSPCTLEASGASIHVDAERVFLSVGMHDTSVAAADDVGWMFLGIAP